jgi:(1->4)-alpha-D-glucan 1-alpha-D-glucosylmutase
MKEHPSIPTATYRVQFHKDFAFPQGLELVSYLSELGISHLYASPIFRAAPGSQHGYDICDHNELNPELGSRDDFDSMAAELGRHGMEMMLDFVPNHMGIAEASNGWWMDVLENGRSSPFAKFFDIDWLPVKRELENKVLLPILGDQYGRVLEGGDLKLVFGNGTFHLQYFDRLLPLAPRSTRPILERAAARLRDAGQAVPVELESILFALSNLPDRTETNEEMLLARAREKEVIKARLARFCAEDPNAEQMIQEACREIETGGTERNFDAFDELLSAQPYRLAYWRVAAEDINYRRFFDINNLAALRMELPEVFEATHKLVFDLLGTEVVSGLRIDHVDGLWDPRGYLASLQEHYAKLHQTPADHRPLYLLVEKILAKDEMLRRDWPVHGTTGYEFGAHVTNVLVDRKTEKVFTEIYRKFVGSVTAFPEIAYEGKLLTMRSSMASEVNVLAHMLNRISETHRWYRDFTLNALAAALREVIACFPVYRTYMTPEGEISPEDARVIQRAISSARRRNPALERSVFEFIRDILLPPEANPHPVDETLRRQFILKLQQCTGPITAKGVEDTAYYVYNRLVALNEVGGDPGVFGTSVEKFHDQSKTCLALFPHTLLTTSTHDTKRSEDVRARLAALTELPQEWANGVRRWHQANRKFRIELAGELAPDANEEYLLYQTLAGTWPLFPMTPEERADYVSRIQNYMVKAGHEAKTNSSWVEPNEAWDKALAEFVARILEPGPKNRFLHFFEPFARRIAELGAINSLAQTVLKLTVPGVPDIYQGGELWDFSLVDPDNRRPVDYAARRRVLQELNGTPSCADLLASWRDGRIKFFVTRRLLQLRRQNPSLFQSGSHEPLSVEGELADHVIAFQRHHQGNTLLVMVPRLTSRVGTPPVGDCWRDTRVHLPSEKVWRNVFSGEELPAAASMAMASALRDFPVAVFFSHDAAI